MKRAGIFIGIDTYNNEVAPLQHAVNNAKSLSLAFARRGYDADFLFNEKCDCSTIISKVLAMINTLHKDDIFVFYFSGHGRNFNGNYYLSGVNSFASDALYDIDSLSIRRLISLTDSVPGLNRIFVLDCCRNTTGAMDHGCSESCDAALEAAVVQNENPDIIPPLIISSCSSGEQTFADPDSELGYFTKAMLSAIQNQEIRNFRQFEENLKITDSPQEQNIRLTNDSNLWNHIPIFPHWIAGKPEKQFSPENEIAKYELPELKLQIKRFTEESPQQYSNHISNLLQTAEQAEKNGDFFAAKHFLTRAITSFSENRNKPYINLKKETADKTDEIKDRNKSRINLKKETADKTDEIRNENAAGINLQKSPLQQDDGAVYDREKKILLKCPGMVTGFSVPDWVTVIGKEAFRECSYLKSVTMHAHITQIEEGAFSGCRSLKEITLPPQLTSIGDKVFHECRSLEHITLPENIVAIGKFAFSGCRNLQNVTMRSVVSIDDGAFFDCCRLKHITLPPTLKFIGKHAFDNCKGLIDIIIPQGVTVICDSSFEDCRSLSSVGLPGTIQTICSRAFCGCRNLKKLRLPDHLTSIGKQAFFNCRSLEQISIPRKIFSIGEEAFLGCNSAEFYIPENSFIQGDCVFPSNAECTFLEENGIRYSRDGRIVQACLITLSPPENLVLPERVTEIADDAFSYFTRLQTVVVPQNVTRIGSMAFYGCQNLREAVIPKSLKDIGDDAFPPECHIIRK